MREDTPVAANVIAAGSTSARWLRRHEDRAIVVVLFMVSMFFHLITAARTITFSDAGDFLMAIAKVGNCHAPGYPLYLMAAKLFTFVFPFGSLPFRVSVLSGLFASLAACLLYRAVSRVTHRRIGGAVAALAFCFSYTFWYQSVIPETYALDAFFITLLVALVLRWERLLAEGNTRGADNSLSLVAFVYGLALTNHFNVLFLIPAFVFFAAATDWRRAFTGRNVARMTVFFLLGLLPYLYEPAAAFRAPAYNYGDPSTLTNWFRHVTLYYVRGGLFGYPLSLFPARLWRYFGTLNTEFPYAAWLGYIGMIATFLKPRKKYAVFLFSAFILSLVPVMTYRQLEPVLRAHFYYPSYLFFSIYIGIGASFLVSLLKRLYVKLDRAVAGVAAAAIAIALLVFPAVAASVHLRKVDKSTYRYARSMGEEMLGNAHVGGIIFADSDNVFFPCRYLQVVEGLGDGVRVFAPHSLGTPGFDSEDMAALLPPGVRPSTGDEYYFELVKAHYRDVPVYLTNPVVVNNTLKPKRVGNMIRVSPPAGDTQRAEGIRDPYRVRPDTDPPLPYEGAAGYGDIDSDAREALLLTVSMSANISVWSGEYGWADIDYRTITYIFEKNLYVPTLYSCETFSNLYDLWGQVLNILKEYPETARELPRALFINPDFASLPLARAYAITGKPDLALAEIDKYLTLNPTNTTALTEKASVLVDLGRYAAALAELDRVLKEGDEPRAAFYRGLALLGLGREEEAGRQFEAVVELDPGGFWGARSREQLRDLKP